MRYLFRDLSFEVPDGLRDQSMVVLVDEDRLALTIARDEKGASLKGYVDDAVTELSESMNAYKLEKRDEKKVGGRNAFVLAQRAISPEGKPVAQLQAYVEHGAEVIVVTATSSPTAERDAHKAFDKVLSTLKTG